MTNDINVHVYHHKSNKNVTGTVLIFGLLGYVIGKLVDKNVKLQNKVYVLEKEIKKYKEEE